MERTQNIDKVSYRFLKQWQMLHASECSQCDSCQLRVNLISHTKPHEFDAIFMQ